MGKSSFIHKLDVLLKEIPEDDRKEMLYDFEEHILIGLENGKTEEMIVEDLGEPSVIAKDLVADYRLKKAENQYSVPNLLNAITATISLSFFNIIFILGPALAVIGIYIGLSAAAIALTLSPIALIVSIIFNGFEGLILFFFLALITCSLGIVLSLGMIRFGKYLYSLVLSYIKFSNRVIKGDKGVKAA